MRRTSSGVPVPHDDAGVHRHSTHMLKRRELKLLREKERRLETAGPILQGENIFAEEGHRW